MMDYFIPTTDEVRRYWSVQGVKRGSRRVERAAEFDCWLKQVKAAAWSEGFWAYEGPNPYREETE